MSIIAALLVLVGVLAGGATFLERRHEAEVAEQAHKAQEARLAQERAAAADRYLRLSSIQSRASSALDHLSELQTTYDSKYSDAANAGQKRHNLVDASPYDVAGALALVRAERTAVETALPMTAEKADAARSAASAFAEAYGESSTSALMNDVSVAAEEEAAALSGWLRGASAINDLLSARANGRYYYQSSDDLAGLYRSADEGAARSRQRWSTVNNRLATLRSRLNREVSAATRGSGSDVH
ncbi:MAG: hypothetical protein JWO85_1216 [Candidatus Eremiobacteraeota bacterium]|nr:hypothetical protein [Candidatus Eremiobacteraeota bacterium]